MSIYYTIYVTTNQVNNKIYIGKHITDNPLDNYLGSGGYLNTAIKKYGKENFKKEVLFIFDNEEDMNAKEKELVDLNFILREDTYNLVLGGNGGQTVLIEGHPKYELTKAKIKKSKEGQRCWTNGVDSVRQAASPGDGWYIGRAPNNNFKWSKEQKQKRVNEYSTGKMNWWNDGVKNKRCIECPGDSWQKGRLTYKKVNIPTRFCDLCQREIAGGQQWQLHINSKLHKKLETALAISNSAT
jgi:hypothetical protein